MVEGVATQQQQLDQVPRDVATWFIRVIKFVKVIRVIRVITLMIDWHIVETTIISKLATCNIEPPGQMGQSEALVDRADVGHAISGVDDNAWKSSQYLNMSHLYLLTALPVRLSKSG